MKAQGPHFRVAFRRRREGKTDYRRRQRLLRSAMPRAVVRKTLNQTLVQIVEADAAGDRVLAAAQSLDLKEHGWSVGTGNVPAAYLTGYLAGKRAVAKGIKAAVLDIGLQEPTRGGRVFAALQGLLDAGMQVPHSKEILPTKARVRGEHIGDAVVKSFEAVKAKLEAS
ncbi:MAG TPA: 50S ribosomal protein L18 [Thermoplasmata archaeon]|nr:50S ribosomal protein L18 [Thermoplasmata archaeon]